MKNSAFDKLWAFIGGAVIGYLVAAFTKGDQDIHQNTQFMISTIGAYVGAAMLIAIYAKWKHLLALWGFWIMIAIAVLWSA